MVGASAALIFGAARAIPAAALVRMKSRRLIFLLIRVLYEFRI
jgi:hypothetical protein